MSNALLKYLLFLWILLLGVSSRANGFTRNISPTISPPERHTIVGHLNDVAAPYIHAPKPTFTLFSIEFFFEDIEEEIEEVEPNKNHDSTHNHTNKPSSGHLGLQSSYNYYYLSNQNLKDSKRYILNCVYLL
ncbi:hypothetical protein GCM10011514_24260 [Emticicia aquatilis]|uniref:Uncharacterized protein n=1 Tax=Emticicia aquatilis TaxID=1537369 RepID=A0A917DPT9_9BACT|nr:hypothetical protein [Emticicia aquatilis]GGD59438.1 hypothetical protein GCM10011514_24260 [Emticicia aquatilis]